MGQEIQKKVKAMASEEEVNPFLLEDSKPLSSKKKNNHDEDKIDIIRGILSTPEDEGREKTSMKK